MISSTSGVLSLSVSDPDPSVDWFSNGFKSSSMVKSPPWLWLLTFYALEIKFDCSFLSSDFTEEKNIDQTCCNAYVVSNACHLLQVELRHFQQEAINTDFTRSRGKLIARERERGKCHMLKSLESTNQQGPIKVKDVKSACQLPNCTLIFGTAKSNS